MVRKNGKDLANGHAQWDGLKHLHPDVGIWGDSHEMDEKFLHIVDSFVSHIDCKVEILKGFSSVNGPGPADIGHKCGRAVHIVATNFTGTLFDLYLEAVKFPFHGIGIYRDWYVGSKKLGGLHLDNYVMPGTLPLRYLCIKNHRGIPQYLDLTVENLKALGIL